MDDKKSVFSNIPDPPPGRAEWLAAIQKTLDMLQGDGYPDWYRKREIVPPCLMADYAPVCDCGSEKGGGGHYSWCSRNFIKGSL